jgi:hypothetical protein
MHEDGFGNFYSASSSRVSDDGTRALPACSLAELPDDILFACASHLSTYELLSLSETCQRLRAWVSENPEPWENACGMLSVALKICVRVKRH